MSIERPTARPSIPDGLRPEIQALRAYAVLVVLLYHLWPERLTGGFIGVDVFFVVSGYLITAHLVRELDTTSTIALARFWARRARRLLPASFAVLGATAVGVLILVPESLWQQFFREIGASAAYVVNWALAADAVDYLAADNVASPVQHYWSLSVEEQLYLVWPLLLLAAVAVARGPRARRWALLSTVGLALIGSLLSSSITVANGAVDAYFVTPGRVWEFAAGAILALAAAPGTRFPDRVAAIGAWVGWIGLVACALFWNSTTPFPGYGAVPIAVFTLLILASGTPAVAWAPNAVVRWRPVQTLGDISYSTYLWHWPLIVLVPFATGRDLIASEKIAIIAVTLLLAWLTTRYVENPIRFAPWSTRLAPRWVLAAAVTFSLLFVTASSAVWLAVQRQNDSSIAAAAELAAQQREQEEAARSGAASCFGAASAVVNECRDHQSSGPFIPTVAAAAQDVGDIYDPACRADTRDPSVKTCTFGSPGGTRVALLGDSHAASWFPAVQLIAEQRGWHLTTFFKGGCSFSLGEQSIPDREQADSCRAWNAELNRILTEEERFDLALTSSFAFHTYVDSAGEVSTASAADGFLEAWEPLLTNGAVVIVLRDVPYLTDAGEACQLENPENPARCEQTRATALQYRDIAFEVAVSQGLAAIDMTDYFCGAERCPTVIGGVLVYRDAHHFTATYARTLAPYLDAELVDAGVIAPLDLTR